MRHRRLVAALAWAIFVGGAPGGVRAVDVSPPAILQAFENSYSALENRMPDIFAAGYGGMYTPPPGRATSGTSVGYDQYDRFDLGQSGDPTLYGTETGLRTLVSAAHTAGLNFGVDLVWNHSGFADASTPGFYESGGYPGLNIRLDPSDPASQGYNDIDGDYHGAFDTGDQNMRLAGLVDIAQEKHYWMIRNPVDLADPRNIRAGSIAFNGRIANRPDPNNARFYPDQNLNPIIVFDPTTGEQNIKIYPFNNASPLAGDAVPEDSISYLMRNAQWLVQSVGIDMFRLDATKNMPASVLNSYDRAVYRASLRPMLDGSQRNVFGFSEYYEGNAGSLESAGVVRKDINPADPGRIGGNRDALDFPLYFALKSNLTSNGLTNDWRNVYQASFDLADDHFQNGSQGVKFVTSHDDGGPDLDNVGYAYTLMLPGNAIVYSNPQEFGTNRGFPKPGRGDAMGGLYGDKITTLLDIRNRYGRGDYRTRLIEKENLAIERSKSAIVLLSNRNDAGFDSRTIATDFQPGQFLIELTGNAGNPIDDPNNDIPKLLTVNADRTVNVRFLRNMAPGTNNFTGDGYLIYGLPTPQGTMTLSNVASILPGWNKNTTGMTADQIAHANATQRVSDVSVIKSDSFDITLRTSKVNLLGNPAFRDHDADGDNALVMIDGGIDLNGNGHVDYVTPGTASYGFEEFATVHQPGYFSIDNNGTYTQSVNAANLSEGYHYITARAFRHRSDGGPAVFTDFRQTIYVDRLPPVSAVASFDPWDQSHPENRDVIVRSVDQTANSVHVILDLPASLSDSAILGMVGNANHASQWDRDLFKYGFSSLTSGNHVVTVVSYEITGNVNVQRFPGFSLQTGVGAGLGDLNHNNGYEVGDVYGTNYGFEAVLYSQNAQFNPAADLNGDGRVDDKDLWLLRPAYVSAGAPQAVIDEARRAELRRGNVNGDGVTDSRDIDYLYQHVGNTSWLLDLAADGGGAGPSDVDAMVRNVFLSEFGDANLDGQIDVTDLGVLASNWQSNVIGWADADFTGDRRVDVSDLGLLASNWQFGVDGAAQPLDQALLSVGLAGINVPEPSVALPMLLLAAWSLQRGVIASGKIRKIRFCA